MNQDEFVDRFWDLIYDVLEEYHPMEIVGMLSYIKSSWMYQFFQALDMCEIENDGEVMFQ